MKIKINIQIFAIIVIFMITKQIEIYAWLMLFTLIHELAHMFMGLLLKLKPKILEIHAFGIGIIFESFEHTEKNKIIIATAGPAINIIIAIIFNFIHIDISHVIINTNLLIAILNLIPIYPLDGGRILKATIAMKNKKKAEKVINKISNISVILLTAVSSIVILIYKNIGLLLGILYLWTIVIKENKRYNLKKKIFEAIEKST